MSDTSEYVHVSEADGVVTIELDRPSAKNALFPQLSRELQSAVSAVQAERPRVAVIRGADGTGSFCAGADLDVTPEEFMENVDLIQDIVVDIYDSGVPFVAEIEGAAIGGGMDLAVACDLRIVSTEATLGTPEVGLGLVPGSGSTRLLPRLVGKAKAADLVLTGRHISGEEAGQMGLATRAVAPDQLREEVEGIAETIAANSPAATAGAIRSLNDAFDSTVEEGIRWDRELVARLVHSPAFEEGTAAFLEQRDPQFQDRS